MTAREVLDRVGERYRGLATYRDRGEVLLRGAEPDSPSTFTTEFHRSSELRFCFLYSVGTIEVIGTAKGALVSTQGLHPPPATLSDAILATKGITFTAGYIVPPLLLPGLVACRPLSKAVAPSLSGKETFGGEPCFVVNLGSDWADGEVLVSDTRFVVRCFRIPKLQFTREMRVRAREAGIAVKSHIVDAEFSLTVTYEPELDDELSST